MRLLDCGVRAVVWFGEEELPIWQAATQRLEFSFRPARTHMKSASATGKGARASGGWIGVTP